MATYKNVMELLVEEEVSRQVKALPTRIASYINQTELVAYALNQLPSLYATSEKGLEHQMERGRAKFSAQISQAVQRAIAAIRRDPLRTYVPLKAQQAIPLREVLQQMQILLRNDHVNWENLPMAVERALNRASQGEISWDNRYAQSSQGAPRLNISSPFPHQIPVNPYPPEQTAEEERPNFVRREPAPDELFGWDDPLYDPHFPK
ncbi:MAG TPA: late competence development ComFB family protein [Coleofasciculaceae cyanobacterium]